MIPVRDENSLYLVYINRRSDSASFILERIRDINQAISADLT